MLFRSIDNSPQSNGIRRVCQYFQIRQNVSDFFSFIEPHAAEQTIKAVEPVIEPLGFDWKLGVGILSGVGAKELVVSTLGVLYADCLLYTSSAACTEACTAGASSVFPFVSSPFLLAVNTLSAASFLTLSLIHI